MKLSKFPKNWIERQGITSWIDTDPRSAAAMIRGKGDGREKNYEKFARNATTKNPELTLEEIADQYELHIRQHPNPTRNLIMSMKHVSKSIISFGLVFFAAFWLIESTTTKVDPSVKTVALTNFFRYALNIKSAALTGGAAVRLQFSPFIQISNLNIAN